MPKFRLTAKAVDDLRQIGRYTEATWGRKQRNRYLSKIDAAFQLLAGNPEAGPLLSRYASTGASTPPVAFSPRISTGL